jgi:2-methylcitrate dehydratase PrpD
VASASEVLAEYYVALSSNHLPAEVLTKAKQCVLDYVGCAIGGVNLESSIILRNCLLREGTNDQGCTVILSGRASSETAAFINAAYGHGLELDDMCIESGGHPGVVIVPTALAVAEEQQSSGLELLTAIVAGYDLVVRVGQAINPDSHFKRGFHPTSTCGVFAAALAAAKLMKLEPSQVSNALGIAGSFASGNLECYADGSLTKRINPGIAAHGGILAAKLASAGYTGPRWVFEGTRGFLVAYSDAGNPEPLLRGLDYQRFGIMQAAFKPYACCRYNHSPIYAVLQLVNDYEIDYREVSEVTVGIVGMAIRAVCEPKEVKYDPKNVVDAQFSLPYSVAVALARRRAFVEEFTEATLTDPAVRDLMSRIRIVHSPQLDLMIPRAFPAEVTIRLGSGKEYYKRVDFCKGDPEEPLTQEELEEKARILVGLSIANEDRIAKLIAAIGQLERVRVSELAYLLL